MCTCAVQKAEADGRAAKAAEETEAATDAVEEKKLQAEQAEAEAQAATLASDTAAAEVLYEFI